MISIIVPVYNAEQYLSCCVDSLLNQTYTDLEIFLVDDGSTDQSAAICDNYAKIDGRVQVIHQKNAGVSAARNAGLTLARGEYIAFADADDFMGADQCETLVHLMQRANAQMAICGFCYEYSNGVAEAKCKESVEKVMTAHEAIGQMLMADLFEGHLWDKLFCRSLLTDLSFDPTICIHEDMLMVYRYLKRCQTVVYSSEPKYHYYIHKESACQGKFTPKFLSSLYAVETMQQDIKKEGEKDLSLWIDVKYVRTCLSILLKLIHNPQRKNYYATIEQKLNAHYSSEILSHLEPMNKLFCRAARVGYWPLRFFYDLYETYAKWRKRGE